MATTIIQTCKYGGKGNVKWWTEIWEKSLEGKIVGTFWHSISISARLTKSVYENRVK